MSVFGYLSVLVFHYFKVEFSNLTCSNKKFQNFQFPLVFGNKMEVSSIFSQKFQWKRLPVDNSIFGSSMYEKNVTAFFGAKQT